MSSVSPLTCRVDVRGVVWANEGGRGDLGRKVRLQAGGRGLPSKPRGTLASEALIKKCDAEERRAKEPVEWSKGLHVSIRLDDDGFDQDCRSEAGTKGFGLEARRACMSRAWLLGEGGRAAKSRAVGKVKACDHRRRQQGCPVRKQSVVPFEPILSRVLTERTLCED